MQIFSILVLILLSKLMKHLASLTASNTMQRWWFLIAAYFWASLYSRISREIHTRQRYCHVLLSAVIVTLPRHRACDVLLQISLSKVIEFVTPCYWPISAERHQKTGSCMPRYWRRFERSALHAECWHNTMAVRPVDRFINEWVEFNALPDTI